MIILIFNIALLIFVFLFIPWFVHIDMVKSNCEIYGWGNFNIFLREFSKRNWYRKNIFPTSYFSEDYYANQIHADIIQFEKKGMVLDFVSFLRFRLWLTQNRLHKQKTENWK